jgi:hypothetical protein
MNDDLRKRLEGLGVKAKDWTPVEGGAKPLPQILAKQKEALLQVKKLLELQVAKDRETLATLHEQLTRAKHGGGS